MQAHTPTCLYASQYSLGPFHIEDKMIVTKAWDSSDGSGCILAPVEADEGKTLMEDFFKKYAGQLQGLMATAMHIYNNGLLLNI